VGLLGAGAGVCLSVWYSALSLYALTNAERSFENALAVTMEKARARPMSISRSTRMTADRSALTLGDRLSFRATPGKFDAIYLSFASSRYCSRS